MKLIYFSKIDSTQKYLLENLDIFECPVCIWSEFQTKGIGSRGNSWIGKKGNLFFSFCDFLQNYSFVPLQSLSIYFGWIMKITLNEFGSKVVFKWPNDLYLNKKIGGVITNVKKDKIVCGIGINTKFAPDGFDCLDIDVKNVKILKAFFQKLKEKPNFDEIISEYKKEFEKTRKVFKIEGFLDKDGSLIKNNKRIYSKR